MTRGFEFFLGVPREVWWDNPGAVVEAVLSAERILLGEPRGTELREQLRKLQTRLLNEAQVRVALQQFDPVFTEGRDRIKCHGRMTEKLDSKTIP